MTETGAVIAACVALGGAGLVGIAAILTASMKLPLPGFKNTAAVERTRGVRLSALMYDALFLLIVAAAAGSYVSGYASTANYKLTPATTRNIYALSTVPLLVLFALGTACVMALHLSAVAPVILTSAATGIAIFLHAQVADGSATVWVFLIAAAAVSAVLTMVLLFQIATTRMHILHWASIASYGVLAFVLWLMVFFTYNVNVFGTDDVLYWVFPAITIGMGVGHAVLMLLTSVHTCDAEEAKKEEAKSEDEEVLLELPVTKPTSHHHSRGHRHSQ